MLLAVFISSRSVEHFALFYLLAERRCIPTVRIRNQIEEEANLKFQWHFVFQSICQPIYHLE